jgi:ribosomal protein L11 methyltransferase
MSKESQKICYELRIQVLEEQKDAVSQLLSELEVGDFVYGQIDCDLEAEYDPNEVFKDLYEKFNQNPPLIVYHEDKEYLASVQKALETLLPKINIPLKSNMFFLEEIADQNWRESWKQSFKPIFVNDIFAILPPWEDLTQFSQKFKIVIDPGMAFGTGQHETTRLCLEMMSNYSVPQRFLDVGTGSGILAIAAKQLGTQFVLGNDIDPECMAVARENAKNNYVETIQFTNKAIFDINEKSFDMIVANIQSKPLKILVPEILKRLDSTGVLILSGILVEEKSDFVDFLNQQGVKVTEIKDLNHWCSIACQSKI